MGRFWISALALVAGTCSLVYAQQAAVALYAAGRSLKDQGITLKAWGSGTAGETDATALEGNTSVRISTRNFFQGGTLIFGQPVNVSKEFDNKDNLLLLALRVADSTLVLGGGGTSGGIAGAGGSPTTAGAGGGGALAGEGGGESRGGRAGGGALAGGGQASGGRGGSLGQAGGSGGAQASGGQAASYAALKTLRLLVTTTDGKKSEAYLPITTSGSGQRGWRTVGVPLQAIAGFDRTNKIIKEVSISGDATATFYLGEMKVINDSTPLYVEPNHRELNLALGSEVEFIAYGQGGASVLKYTWNFGADAAGKAGTEVDAEGQVVKRKFRKPGTYTITLTVSDAYGLKKPYSTQIKVVVNP